MMRTYRACREIVRGSPHVFFVDGSDVHDPGVRMHQVGRTGAVFIVLDGHDPTVYRELVDRAASAAA